LQCICLSPAFAFCSSVVPPPPPVPAPSLHHALPISVAMTFLLSIALTLASVSYRASMNPDGMVHIMAGRIFMEEGFTAALKFFRSEEHTTELQSRENLVCRLLLAKKTAPPRTAFSSR